MQVNCWQLDYHANAAGQCRAHCPGEHIQGFTRSCYMLPLGKCLRRITLAAIMGTNVLKTHKTLTKNYFQLETNGTINH
jgi:hypothetical protein